MNSHIAGRRTISSLITLGLAVAAVGLVWNLSDSNSARWALLTKLSAATVGPGRLYRAPTISLSTADYQKAVVEAELARLSMPDSDLRRRIEALLEAGAGNLERAAETLRELVNSQPQDAELLNDLGVIYLAMAESNTSNYFRAARLFEFARKLSIHAPAPTLNAAYVYKHVGLDALADRALLEYGKFTQTKDSVSQSGFPVEAELMELLRRKLDEKDIDGATELLRSNLTTYRKLVLERLLNSPDSSVDNTTEFISSYCEKTLHDFSVRAMFTPLQSPIARHVIESRNLVKMGIEAYQRGEIDESLRLYTQAESPASETNSVFDTLWVKLNRADAELRVGNTIVASPLLETVIQQSRVNGYKWLQGKALAAKGSDSSLMSNYDDVLQVLDEAIQIFNAIASPQDAARAMYYQSSVHSFAGDFETGLNITYRALALAPQDDYIRRAQLHWLAGLQLYRLGFEEYATPFEEMSVREATAAGNPALVGFFSTYTAMMHAARGDYEAATKYSEVMRTTFDRIKVAREKNLNYLNFNLVCARIKSETGKSREAKACLDRNIKILDELPIKVPYYYVQTLLQLSEIHSLEQNIAEARRKLMEAAEILESNDVYLAAAGLRMAFENDRRAFYENAIAFEYRHDGHDAAWQHVQEYRSKLFLEFLAQIDRRITELHREAIDQAKTQQLLPANVQVLEYVVLSDRLLIWLVSNEKFLSVSVPITRKELERKVADFLKRVQNKDEFEKQASDLHGVLIEPIEAHLDPKRAIAIIPDQSLHRLNFPALYSARTKSYLVERYTILGNPSLTSLLSAGAATPTRASAIAFGAQTDDTNASLELKEMQKYYSGLRTFDGPAALKPEFLSSMPTAGVFHYAGHSQDASDPLRSAILLDGKREGPNSVTAVDITKVKMSPNSVVILASCDSSVGNSRDGVGIRGLTSAFLISGAGSVVGSLWLVESKSTSRLVLAFHKYFAQDRLSVAEALRKAQLEFIKEDIHPYYWSGFVVTGNVSALR